MPCVVTVSFFFSLFGFFFLFFTNQSSVAVQTKIADLVQIAPDDFRKQSYVAIEDNINAKYANKARSAFLCLACLACPSS